MDSSTLAQYMRDYLFQRYQCTCNEESCNESPLYLQYRDKLCGNYSTSTTNSYQVFSYSSVMNGTASPMATIEVENVLDFFEASHDLPLSTSARSILIAAYVLVILLTLIGNSLVIFVLAKSGRSRSDLNTYLINLSIADIIIAVLCMPFTLTQVSVLVSIFTLSAVAVDRHKAVANPIGVRTRLRRSRKITVIASIWGIAAGLSTVQLVIVRARQFTTAHNVTMVQCEEIWSTGPSAPIIYEFLLFCLTFALPFFILCITYSMIVRRLWTRHLPGNQNSSQQLRIKWKVLRMVLLVVLAFFVCWLPLQCFRLVLVLHPEITKSQGNGILTVKIYFVVHLLAMSDSFLNPLIYTFLNENFRDIWDDDIDNAVIATMFADSTEPSVITIGTDNPEAALSSA
ncbi:QRFP-like peptide receptor [Glandiceps talaboti]